MGGSTELTLLKAAAARMGSPEDAPRVIHVAGTNGKGSVAAMCAAALAAAGHRVGLYTSPHLDRVNERIMVNGAEIPDADFARALTEARGAAAGLSLTYFEALTLTAFKYFADERVNFLVLETGLGGRLDATNIVSRPEVCAITSIDFDHMQYLGKDKISITVEKAGIVKQNCILVLYSAWDGVYNTVKEICAERGARFVCPREAVVSCRRDGFGLALDVRSAAFRYKDLRLGLGGDFQARNALTALTVLNSLGSAVPSRSVREGLAAVKWPCRMELIEGDPPVILDGAHNGEAARALAGSVRGYFPAGAVYVIGVMADKDAAAIVSALTENAVAAVFTRVPSPRSAKPDELAPLSLAPAAVEDDARKAISIARGLAPAGGAVVVCGSLYLAAQARRLLLELK
ncbi:MAG: bifunctional folylpolyglutamate synthase/dihydrofolate synthase [Clostridiales bacterium]|jgi:dihydrofolate synthase/folylpolyglutamate synthase|nr:bifunctional folylpolyglutamate synthase/dihydrofolate synthase [Clostridiales bacterium]